MTPTVHTKMYMAKEVSADEIKSVAAQYAADTNQNVECIDDHTKLSGVWLVRLTAADAVDAPTKQLELF